MGGESKVPSDVPFGASSERIRVSKVVFGGGPSRKAAIRFVPVHEAWAEPRARTKALAERLSTVLDVAFFLSVIMMAVGALLGRKPENVHWMLLVMHGILVGVMFVALYGSRRVRKLLEDESVQPKPGS